MDPEAAFIARRLREMQNQNREQFHVLRAELVRTREAIERLAGDRLPGSAVVDMRRMTGDRGRMPPDPKSP